MRAITRFSPSQKHTVMQFNSSSILLSLKKGISFHQLGNLKEAEKIYRDVISTNSAQPDALHLLGLIELQNGNPETAASLIQQAILVKKDNVNYHFNLGVSLFQLNALSY